MNLIRKLADVYSSEVPQRACGPEQRPWVLAVPALSGLGLGGAAVWLAARRDVGSALLTGVAGPARASQFRRRPLGFAAWIHRPATAGWLAGSCSPR